MQKLFLLFFMFALVGISNFSPKVKAKKRMFQKGSVKGVVIARERKNGDYSLGVSVNYKPDKDKDIDEIKIKLPFKYKSEIGFSDKGWDATIKGATVTIKREEKTDEKLNDEEQLAIIQSLNMRFNYRKKYKTGIIDKLKVNPIRYVAYSDGDKVYEEKVTVKFMPSFGFTDNVFFVPGFISPGEEFSGTLNDDVEQYINRILLEAKYGNLDNIDNKKVEEFSTTTKLRGNFDFSLEREGMEVEDQKISYRSQITIDSIFGGDDKIRIRYNAQIPEKAKPKDNLKVNYKDRFGESFEYYKLVEELNKSDFNLDGTCKFRIKNCSKYGFAGQTLCACGCFDQDYGNGFSLDGFTLDGKDILPLAGSQSAITFYLANELTPGEHTITYRPKGDAPTSVKFTVLKVKGVIDQSKLWTGQSTLMRLEIKGTNNKLPIEVENTTPDIIRLAGGDIQVTETSGGPTNLITRGVKGIQRGDFAINYKLDLPPCPCQDLEEESRR